jgi:cytochrome c oxidase cbb3-type subunit 1
MDWQLYGWCSLPLVGLLMALFFESDASADAHVGFFGWSFALALGGAMSLCGFVSGKLFLNFDGLARMAFPTAQLLLWAVLAAAGYVRWRRIGKFDTKQWFLAGMLLLLFVSPISLLWAAGAEVYPPIDPESGGATGHSLLASTLGILFIFGLLPRLLRLTALASAKVWTRRYAVTYVLSLGAWSLLDHGNASNTQVGQVLGLCVLLVWVPILRAYYRSFAWTALIQPWLRAFFFWWGLLTVTGCISFLPGMLDLMKFTNGLVAHAHLAMAGMLGAFNMLILGSLGHVVERDPWADRFGFWCWQIGTLIYVVAMWIQGVREGLDPTVLFGYNSLTSLLYFVRLIAGLLLVLANVRWLYLLEAVRGELRPEGGDLRVENGDVCYES